MQNTTKIQGVYLGIIIVLLAVIAGGYFYFHQRQNYFGRPMMGRVNVNQMPPAGPNARGRGTGLVIMGKGMNLKTSPVFQYAYQLAPGEIPTSTQQILTGFNVTTKTQSDGSILVTLAPKDSEGQNQQYIVKSGQTLYFIEQTPLDDKTDQDKDLNYRDDYGIIVDQNGIIQ